MLYGKFFLLTKLKLPALWYMIPINWTIGTIAQLPYRSNLIKGLLIEITDDSKNLSTGIKGLRPAEFILYKFSKSYIKRLIEVSSFWKFNFGRLINPIEKYFVSEDNKNLLSLSKNKFEPLRIRPSQRKIFIKLFDPLKNKNCILAPPGFGKTELMLLYASFNLKMKRSTLIIVPEIATSEWLFTRANKKSSEFYMLWHSSLTPGQRKKVVQMASSGLPCVVIGTRSSIFLPFKELDTIFVDECHDKSLSQNSWPYYEICSSISNLSESKIIIMTATPNSKIFSLIDFFDFNLLVIPPFPKPRLKINLIPEHRLISKSVFKNLKKSFLEQKSSLIFLNHRGYSNRVMDLKTNQYLRCLGCKRYLFYHREELIWRCNECKKGYDPKSFKGGESRFVYPGTGVERLREEILEEIPDAEVIWVSSDLNKTRVREIYNYLASGTRPIILVMTQIMIKGHHFDNLGTLIYVDTHYSFNLNPMEKLIGLIQFSGRAKRKTYVQTYDKEQEIFEWESCNNYLEKLIRSRKEFYITLKYRKNRSLIKLKVNLPSISCKIVEISERSNDWSIEF